MNPLQRLGAGAARLFAAVRLPAVPTIKPLADGIAQRPEQAEPFGLVTDFAIDRFALALTRIPDPDDVLRRVGMHRHDLKRLEFDDEISGALETRREAAITTPWHLDSDSEAGKEQREWVENELKPIFDDMMRGCWNAVPYGYSVTEAVYAPRDGNRIGIARMSVKPMQWFEPLRDGRLVLIRPGEGVRVELDQKVKFCKVVRNGTYQNPYGEALLSRLYWCWYFRHTGWKAWMQFVERFGDPFVIGKSANPQELVTALLGMGVKNVIGVGSNDEVEVLLQNGDATFDRLDSRLTERILKLIQGQTLTSGAAAGGGGSYALGKVHETVRQDKRLADVRLLQTAGQWLVDALWELNSFPGDAPKFIFADPADIALDRADRDVALVNAGIVKLSQEYIQRSYGFEDGDFEIPEAPPAGALPGQPALPVGPKAKAKAIAKKLAEEHRPRPRGRDGFTKAQLVVEGLGDAVIAGSPTSPISAADIRAAILASKDRDELEDRMAQLIAKENPAFAAVLEKAMFAADVIGYIHSEEGD